MEKIPCECNGLCNRSPAATTACMLAFESLLVTCVFWGFVWFSFSGLKSSNVEYTPLIFIVACIDHTKAGLVSRSPYFEGHLQGFSAKENDSPLISQDSLNRETYKSSKKRE